MHHHLGIIVRTGPAVSSMTAWAGHGPGGISARRPGGNRAGEIRIGRFLRNGKVSEDRIIGPVAVATPSHVGGLHVLSIRDTTGFRYDGRGNGLVGHATMAVEAEQGTLPGLPDAGLIERGEDDPKPPPGRPFRDRRSCRWMAGQWCFLKQNSWK